MHKIIPAQLDWTRFTSPIVWTSLPAPDSGSHLNSHAVLFETPPLPLLDLSRAPIATAASSLFFSERRPAAVTDDESPIIDAHTITPLFGKIYDNL
ncbi:hypothetical protein Zmor_015073 [Zophobas morio]|uniref:Uncharacterized protein n=1 Tax=Zophobas morio TaxID=2755281 RepID=A0AA38IIP0_9CUCU|nr:hypothetical protein Zmor_015073 [Zophobas morio]